MGVRRFLIRTDTVGAVAAVGSTDREEPNMAQAHHEMPTPSPWVGMAVFGGMMLIVAGALHALAGLVGIFNDDYWLASSRSLVIPLDYNVWGWAHLLLGALAFAAGIGILLGGQTWAWVSGVVLATFSAVVNVAFLAAHPLWAMVIIALDVLVIYALIAHGKDIPRDAAVTPPSGPSSAPARPPRDG
jgi:hypothetical protein